jgi:serine/threonine protein kinase
MIQNVAIGIAKETEYLHKNEVVHRDLQPKNVGLNEDGLPKTFNLGFAHNHRKIN